VPAATSTESAAMSRDVAVWQCGGGKRNPSSSGARPRLAARRR